MAYPGVKEKMSVSVEIKTRPIRLAFLVDPNNSEQVGEAILLSSTLWGGRHFPIVELHETIPAAWEEKPLPGSPVEGPSTEEVVLGYINAFDPDFLVQLSEDVPKYVRDLGIRTIKPADIWGDLNGWDESFPSLGVGLFEILGRVFEERFRSVDFKIVFPKLPEELYLFWAGVYGDVPPKFDRLLEARCFRQPEVDIFRTDFGNGGAVRVLVAQKFSATATTLFPVDLVCLYTNSFHSVFDKAPHIFFMDAANVGDVVDFWNLRAMGKSVLPVPVQFKENLRLKESVADFLKQPKHGGDPASGTGIQVPTQFLRARSRSMEETREYADSFDGASSGLCGKYPRIWSAGSSHDSLNHIYGEERSFINPATSSEDEIRIRSVLPKFRYYGRQRPVCANEITIDSYMGADLVAEAFPRSSGENFLRALSGPTSFPEDWRGGRSGLVKLAKNGFFGSQEVPSAEKVFFAWLTDLGWKRPELSTAGVLAKRIHQKLGGFVSRLQDKRLLGLLEHMNGGSVAQDGTPLGVNRIDQEREMSVAEVKNRLERQEPASKSLYNYALENGFFRLGAQVKCPNCFRRSWYSLESIKDSLVCPKCLETFNAVGNLDAVSGSPWHYKTVGPFSIPNYADGAYGVLLSLHFFNSFKQRSKSSITPVLSFKAKSPEGQEKEVDFAAFWRSQLPEGKVELIIGECKTYGKFGEADFEKMEYLAQAFEKQKPVLVFSTLRESLEAEEKERISCLAQTSPVIVLTARELFQSGDYGLDLQNICDVTQKSYLGSEGNSEPGK